MIKIRIEFSDGCKVIDDMVIEVEHFYKNHFRMMLLILRLHLEALIKRNNFFDMCDVNARLVLGNKSYTLWAIYHKSENLIYYYCNGVTEPFRIMQYRK